MEKFSAESLLKNEAQILQPKDGYRFSMDALLLACHIVPDPNDTIIDIGTGCGIIPLILAERHPQLDITGVEIQEELFEFARQNIKNHHLTKKINLINTDIRQTAPGDFCSPADIIVSNPPYKKKDTGRLNPIRQKAIARHEIHLDIDQLFACAARLLKKRGRLYLIFPADRIGDLFSAMAGHKFWAKHIRFIHTKKKLPAKRIILEAVKQTSGFCTVSAPLYIYSDNDTFTADYLSLYRPG